MGRHAKALRRQVLARRKAVTWTVSVVLTALGAGAVQVTAHGWHEFTARPPGVGGTPDNGP